MRELDNHLSISVEIVVASGEAAFSKRLVEFRGLQVVD